MKYLYLPGFSPLNVNEFESFANYFSEKGIELQAHKWRHWEDESVKWFSDVEVENILKTVSLDESYIVMGKSIGTYITARLAKTIPFERIILMGVPYNGLSDKRKGFYRKLDVSKLHVFQRENDSYGNAQNVKDFLGLDDDQLSILEGDSHLYDIPEAVYDLVDG